jgi:oligopeptide/dipeptide ABC transporter ATP-binding protein
MTAFSPVHTIGDQISEMVVLHTGLEGTKVRDRVVGLLDRVGISNPSRRFAQYPHELSGGMRQRAMIALALSCNPRIILADEPTTALDVTIQAQILDLLKELQREEGMSIVYVTHNMAVVAETVDRVYVMYLGQVVESTTTQQLFANPLHPYTQKLLRSIPKPGEKVEKLEVISGTVPAPIDLPRRCGFVTRCQHAIDGLCDKQMPALHEKEPGHLVRCFLYSQETEPEDEWTNV